MTRPELRVFLMTWFCGCGSPETATASLLRLLEQYSDEHREADGEPAYKALPKWIPDEGIMFLVLYWLSDLDLIEHGGGVLASWLTGKGQAVLDALRKEKADGFEALHAPFCAHGYDLDDKTHDCMKFEKEQPS